MLNPLAASRQIEEKYRRYLTATFGARRDDLRDEFARALASEFILAKGPYLQASPPYEPSSTIRDLVGIGLLNEGVLQAPNESLPVDRALYLHQVTALEKAVGGGRNLVIATGTGSGKTECFLLPILHGLLKERDEGTLERPGVRALLLYPMNALANDQVKRLRGLLTTFPDITFGRYIGETAHKLVDAEDDFRKRYPFESRLPNEFISREQMQEQPPHILLTNYAMLEYLLLRPTDSPMFDGEKGKHWRQVVLDEAHVYRGATGAEIAMLLRRVRDRVNGSTEGNLQCFATSATLGKGRADFPALADFASTLFSEPFEWTDVDEARQDVVSATRKSLRGSENPSAALPQALIRPLLTYARDDDVDITDVTNLLASHGVEIPESAESKGALLAQLLSTDAHVVKLQELLEQGPVLLEEATSRVLGNEAAHEDLVDLVELGASVRRGPNDSPVLPAHYHFFLRALEGAFLCLHPEHPVGESHLRLSRHTMCPSCERVGLRARMFEIGVCRHCGAEFLLGLVKEGEGGDRLEPATFVAGHYDRFLLGTGIDDEDEDESAAVPGVGQQTAQGVLCPGCGAVGTGDDLMCDCVPQPKRIAVTKANPALDSDVLRICPACARRTTGEIVYRFVTGSDAPASVIATDLYQALPPLGEHQDKPGEGRRLLTFSDSRQDAAFFAPYLERTYGRAVQRSLIWDALMDFGESPPRFGDLVVPIRERAIANRVVDPNDGPNENSTKIKSWLMAEILSTDRRQSLTGSGLAEIVTASPADFAPPEALLSLGLTEEHALDLILVLLDTMRVQGAVDLPTGVDIKDDLFSPRNVTTSLRDINSERSILSWLPTRGTNRRLEFLTKVFAKLSIDENPLEFLEGIWRNYLARPGSSWGAILVSSSDRRSGVTYALAHERFEFRPLTPGNAPYRCQRCRQLWWRSIADVCPTYRCDGRLIEVEAAALLDNHYARLYVDLQPISMAVEEHTAQVATDRASAIQDQFVRGDINVLSCSTTFELGVDVGEIQAVFLRNVPPSPANYVQRAGRAGRRLGSPALIVTFAQRRNHDLSYFSAPLRMVDGVIDPPSIVIDNSAIVRRHVHSMALAAFQRQQGDHKTVEEFFAAPDSGESAADQRLLAWLRTHPSNLGQAIARVVPAGVEQEIGANDWGWVDALATPSDDDPTHGWLGRAGDEARDDLGRISDLIVDAVDAENFGRAAALKRTKNALASRQLLSFLASRNVLPKYGFPVDSVQLDLSTDGSQQARSVELSRDLKMAISEYAPGGKVVAAKTLWESVGLRVLPDRNLPRYHWGICTDCESFRSSLEELEPCGICGSTNTKPGRKGTFVKPMYGFVGAASKERPGDSRPVRASVTETYFGAYRDAEPTPMIEVPELSHTVAVQARYSRQGLITVVNRGAAGRGFLVCEWCGFSSPGTNVGKATVRTHRLVGRRKDCNGTLRYVHLGHDFLTDVVEVQVGVSAHRQQSLSALYALLAAGPRIGIERDEIDGTLHYFAKGTAPSFVIHDEVAGGAGHARRILDHLPELFAAALAITAECECGAETSCYNCLRTYRNQNVHDELARGDAAQLLAQVLGQVT